MRKGELQPHEDLDLGAIAKMLMQLFDHWKLSTEEQLDMLGLATDDLAALAKYRRGQPIAPSQNTIERAGHLLAIHQNLRLLFPHNQELAYKWIRSSNKAFGGRTPVEVIHEYGFSGMLMVRDYLDNMLHG